MIALSVICTFIFRTFFGYISEKLNRTSFLNKDTWIKEGDMVWHSIPLICFHHQTSPVYAMSACCVLLILPNSGECTLWLGKLYVQCCIHVQIYNRYFFLNTCTGFAICQTEGLEHLSIKPMILNLTGMLMVPVLVWMSLVPA